SSPGEGWRFTTPSYNYTWSPATALSATTGASVTSTGLAATQVYTVTARDIYSYCAGNVARPSVNVTPMNTYSVTGGNGCTGTGVTVGLSGSDTGSSYQLYRNGATVGSPVSGTGSTLSFGTFSVVGNYTVAATRGSCSVNMLGGDTIRTTPSISVGASPAICQPSTTGVLSYTGATGSPNRYSITWSSAATSAGFSPVTNAVLGGATIDLTAPSGVTGTYTGSVTVSANGCSSPAYTVNLSVYAQPTGGITSVIQPCSGYSASITITGTPGADLNYRVDGGSLIAATIGVGGTYTIATGAVTSLHTYQLHNIYNPACANTYDTTVIINPIAMQWVGGVSGHENDWATAANWSCGNVPGASDSVLIPLTTYAPVIGAGTSALSGGIKVDSGVVVTVNAGGDLNIKGGLTHSGAFVGQGPVIFSGATAQTYTGMGSAGFFQLNNTGGATISAASRLTDTLRTNDSLVIGASTLHTGRIAAITGTGFIQGKARVMQSIQGGYRRYRFWAHPFSETIPYSQMQRYIDLTGAGGASNGFTTTGSNAPSVYRYNTLAGNSTLAYDPGWKVVTSALPSAGDTNQIHRYEGVRVFLRGAKGEGLGYASYTPSATVIGQWGQLNQGRQVIHLVRGSGTGQDYNLLGNPYAAPVDLGTAAFNAKAAGNIIGSFYVWNPTLGTGGQFTTY
ncbi:MAG: hypothetical protein EBZ77_12355, partial [Chitinophagia bacterium]|nr:hypothetical protein [Chitinophagia bacterium]